MRRVLPVVLIALVGALVAALLLRPGEPSAPPSHAVRVEDGAAHVREHVAVPPAEVVDASLGALDVHVIDEVGDPIPGATVETHGLAETFRATADENGVACLRGLPCGELDVRASAPGRAPSPPVEVSLPPGLTINESILLGQAHRLDVRVVDRHGEPLEGIRVFARPPSDDRHREAVTDAAGRCAFDDLPRSRVGLVTLPDSFRAHRSVDVPTPEDREVQIVLEVRGEIEGRVTERDSGLPVAGIEVGWAPFKRQFAAHATTGGDGCYRIRVVAMPGPWVWMQVRAVGYRGVSKPALRPPLTAGGPWRADFVVERTGVVELVLEDDDGRPIAGHDLIAEGAGDRARVETDVRGRAVLSGFRPGVVRIDVRGAVLDGVVPSSVRVPESGRVVVPLRALRSRALTVRGTVVDAEGHTVSGAIVTTGTAIPAVSDDDGRFELVAPVYYQAMSHVTVGAALPGDPPTRNRFERALVGPGRVLDGVQVVLLPPTQVQGRLVDEDGAPVEGGAVWYVPSRRPVRADGSFCVRIGREFWATPTSASGAWPIQASAPGRQPVAITFELRPGEVVDVGDVVLPHAPPPDGQRDTEGVHPERHVVSGSVVFDDDGSPVRGALVTAGPQELGMHAITDDAGRFSIDAEGDFDRLGVSPLSEVHAQGLEAYFKVQDTTRGPLILRVRRGGVVRGRLLHGDGRPAACIGLLVSDDHGEHRVRTATDADGRFTFQGVPTDADLDVLVFEGRSVVLQRACVASPEAHVELRLESPETITGIVRLPDGEEIGDLELVAMPLDEQPEQEYERKLRALLAPDGGFTLRCADGRRYTLQLKSNNRFFQRLVGGSDVPAGARDVELRAKAGVSYSGIFIRNDGAPPQTYVCLSPVDPVPGRRDARAFVETAEDGTFQIDGLEPGIVYRVSARDHPDGGWVEFGEIRLGEGGLRGATLELK